jgi:hypothetical protein
MRLPYKIRFNCRASAAADATQELIRHIRVIRGFRDFSRFLKRSGFFSLK